MGAPKPHNWEWGVIFDGWTHSTVEAFILNRRKIIENMGLDVDDPGVPLGAGFVSTEPAPPEAIQHGRDLAERYGW